MEKYVLKIGSMGNNTPLELVGGKALPFFDLLKMGARIPSGFVVTTDAYDLFLRKNGLISDFDKIFRDNKKNNEELVNNLKSKVAKSDFPLEIRKEIQQNIKNVKAKSFAVRSSATVEDSGNNSWAGEFDSYLNIKENSVVSHIKKCWLSVLNTRAIEYAKNISGSLKIKMAVIVQEAVEGDVSGVCFTRNPLDSEDDDIRIEAVFGMGDLLVQGEVVPDSYLVERDNDLISEVVVREQKSALVFSARNGLKKEKIDEKYKQKLKGKEIIELSREAQKIEKFYKTGQDIEWTKKGKLFYILQSRPITTN